MIYALYASEINIIGIVADYGNVSRENAGKNAEYLKEVSGRFDIPVIGGAERSLTGEKPVYYPDIHGKAGFGPITPQVKNGAQFFENFYEITNLIKKYENNLTIVNIGRLSSLATAYILYPSILARVKDIFIMGGAFLYPGNITPSAEANFYSDPYAANLVLTCAEHIRILPLNVTNQAILLQEQIDYLDRYYKQKGDPVGQLLKPLIDYYYGYYKKIIPDIKGGPLHDVLTLWATVNEEYFSFIERPVKVVAEEGEARGLSIGDFRPYYKLEKYPMHRIAVGFNYGMFSESIMNTLMNGKSFKT